WSPVPQNAENCQASLVSTAQPSPHPHPHHPACPVLFSAPYPAAPGSAPADSSAPSAPGPAPRPPRTTTDSPTGSASCQTGSAHTQPCSAETACRPFASSLHAACLRLAF